MQICGRPRKWHDVHKQQLGVGCKMVGHPPRSCKGGITEINSDDDLPKLRIHLPHKAKSLDASVDCFGAAALRAASSVIGAMCSDTTSHTACAAAIATCCVAYDGARNSSANESSEFRSVRGRSRRAIGRKPSAI